MALWTLLAAVLLLLAPSAQAATPEVVAESPEIGIPGYGDKGETPDSDYPCQKALLRPIGKDKRVIMTPRQIAKNVVLQQIVNQRSLLVTPPSCKVATTEFLTACIEKPTNASDLAEYGEREEHRCCLFQCFPMKSAHLLCTQSSLSIYNTWPGVNLMQSTARASALRAPRRL